MRVLLRIALAMVGIMLLLYVAASWFLTHQVTLAQRHALDAHPADLGLAFEDVEFPARGGDILLKGWLVLAPEAQSTIIVAHGINSNRADAGPGLLEIARDLSQRDFNVLLFDLRGHGESGGTQVSGGYFERLDALGAFDLLLERGVPAKAIGMLGYSMGGSVVLLAAGDEPRLRAVVADSAFADAGDLIVAETQRRTPAPAWLVPPLMPGMRFVARSAYGIDLAAIRPEAVVARLDYPVLLIHGTADTRIPAAHSQRMGAAARHPDTELWLLDGVAHAKAYSTAPDQYIDRVAAYFEARLRSPGVTPTARLEPIPQ